MEVEVYADLLFLVNFSMDFLTLYACARLCCRPLLLRRALLSALLGAAYALLSLLYLSALPPLLSLAIDLPVCLLLCRIGLWRRGEHWRTLVRLGAVYLLISALLGGVMTLLSTLLNRLGGGTIVSDPGNGEMTYALFSLAAPLATGLAVLLSRLHRRAISKRTVRLHWVEGGRSVTLNALCDSGNLLREPLSARPVIPVDRAAARALLPPPVCALAELPHPAGALPTLPDTLLRRTRLLPAAGATGERLLVVYLPEQLFLENERGQRRLLDAYLSPVPLPRAKEYAAILPAELLVH